MGVGKVSPASARAEEVQPEPKMCECDRPDESDNPHRHPFDVACLYWIAGRPSLSALTAAATGRLPLTWPRLG